MEFVERNERVKEGHEADIIGTSLDNLNMPFVRYAIGDRSTYVEGQCKCGRQLTVMGPVVGRITDFVTLPNGERKSFLYLHEIFERTGADRWISQLRVSQERDDLIIFTVVPREEISPERKEMVENALRRGLDGADAELRIVKEILPDKSGKTARII